MSIHNVTLKTISKPLSPLDKKVYVYQHEIFNTKTPKLLGLTNLDYVAQGISYIPFTPPKGTFSKS